MLKLVIKIANLALLLLFAAAFGSTVFTSSFSSILTSPIQFISALCVVIGVLVTVWTMLPSMVPKFAFLKQMLMGTALGCAGTWLWMWWTGSLGNVCSGLSLGSFCGGDIMHWVLIVIYVASALLQFAFAIWCIDGDGSAHGFSAQSLSKSAGGGAEMRMGSTRGRRGRRGGVGEAWSEGSGGSDEEKAERGMLTGKRGRRGDGGDGSEWDSEMGGSSSEEERARAYDPPAARKTVGGRGSIPLQRGQSSGTRRSSISSRLSGGMSGSEEDDVKNQPNGRRRGSFSSGGGVRRSRSRSFLA